MPRKNIHPEIINADCPACDGKIQRVASSDGKIRECLKCGAIHGEADYRVSCLYVLPEWSPCVDVHPDNLIYYDFTGTDSTGESYRRHGWFNLIDRKIVQTG